jgi:nickel-dependent lactate racemase
MDSFFRIGQAERGLTHDEIRDALCKSLKGRDLKKVLIVPPDFTRFHSNAGFITNVYYHALKDIADVDIIPALGTHAPMTREECQKMYGDIPFEKFIEHRWRDDVVNIGTVPEKYLREISEDTWTSPVECEVNKILFGGYDLIISVGQVVPHEVIGMSNHSKNIFVGLGGSKIINASHMVGALYGLERMMGKDNTPTRKLFDYCLANFLNNINILWVLTVTTAPGGIIRTHGLFIGEDRQPLEQAIRLAKIKNMDIVEKPIKKCVVYLDPKEFKSTWLGNKAVYRTRMALADGGELIVLAPGVRTFGEDERIDGLIRKYGYVGREKVLRLFRECEDLQKNMSAAAHLIHGSSDGRFRITYAVQNISREEIEKVNYACADYGAAAKLYPPDKLKAGRNVLGSGEEIFFIPNPALGLWIEKGRL